MPAAADDWRRMGQEAYLPPGTEFAPRPYSIYREGWDHDHCEMCTAKLVEATSPVAEKQDVLTEGFATTDQHPRGAEYFWICEDCFHDFANEFGWREVPAA